MGVSIASPASWNLRQLGFGPDGAMPREARDTLFLLGVIAWTLMPHLTHLPVWTALLSAAVLLWRGRLALRGAKLPGRWTLAAVLVVALGLTFWSFRGLLGKEPGVTMIVVLMALKTLELRARRDAIVVFFLGFFVVLTNFLFSQSLLVALAMLGSVWGLLTALVLAHMPAGYPSLRQAGWLSGRTALLGVPVMVLLFLFFPRLGPLWGVPQDGLAKTGLSNSMRMGSVAEVAQNDEVALRVRFDGKPPAPGSLYFRGPVLSRFDGAQWLPSDSRRSARVPANLRVGGEALAYEMTLEPQRLAQLPLLEAAPQAPTIEGMRVDRAPALQWVAERPVTERLRFRAQAFVTFLHGPTEPYPALAEELALPPERNLRALAWAAQLRASPEGAAADAEGLSELLLRHIRSGGFSYTLAPGPYGTDAVDEFWLDRKEGFCEHFAASYVVLMRAMGVPARVVTGYQGADQAPVDGFYVVRQSAAHAWAEYWQAGAGWVRADPTAAVAPDRIDRSRNLVPAPGLVGGALRSVSPELLALMRNGWEAVNNRWNQWVLSYSQGKQQDLLKKLGLPSSGWEDVLVVLVGALSTLALAGAAWAWWDRRRIDPWVRQAQRVRLALQSLGLIAEPADAPRVLADRLRARFGERAKALVDLLDTWERQRYGRDALTQPDGRWLREWLAQAALLGVAERPQSATK